MFKEIGSESQKWPWICISKAALPQFLYDNYFSNQDLKNPLNQTSGLSQAGKPLEMKVYRVVKGTVALGKGKKRQEIHFFQEGSEEVHKQSVKKPLLFNRSNRKQNGTDATFSLS